MLSKRWKLATVLAGACLLGGLLFRHHAPVVAPAELPAGSLVLREGRMYPRAGGGPFTGNMFERSYTGQRLSEVPLQEGIVHGLARGWYDSGALETEERFDQGLSQGVRQRWHANGKLKSEATVVKGQLQGTYQEWFDSGIRAVATTLVDGKAHGLCESWHPDGTLKSRVQLELGNPTTTQFFTAGTQEVIAP